MAAEDGPFIQGRKYRLPAKDICAVYVGTPAGGNPEFKIDISAVLDELTPCEEEGVAGAVDDADRSPNNRAKAVANYRAGALFATAPAASPAAPPAAPTPGNKKGNIPNKSASASAPEAAAPSAAPPAAPPAVQELENDPVEESAPAPAPQKKADYLLKIDGDYYHTLFSNSPANASGRATIEPQVTPFITNGVITIEVTITDAGGTQTKKIKDAKVTFGKNETGREIATITGGNKVTYFDTVKQAWLDFKERLQGGARKKRQSKRTKRTVKKTKKTRRHL
jgi:hypothetical protein